MTLLGTIRNKITSYRHTYTNIYEYILCIGLRLPKTLKITGYSIIHHLHLRLELHWQTFLMFKFVNAIIRSRELGVKPEKVPEGSKLEN